MTETKTYFGGVPTDIEIKQLREAYPDVELTPGRVISYEDIESLIGTERGTARWQAVTNRWRRIVENATEKVIGTDPGIGFKVLVEGEKVMLSTSKLRTAGRMARRSYVVASRVDIKALTEQEKTEYDHAVRRSAALLQAARLKSRVALPEVA